MKKFKCTKHFPKKYQAQTTFDQSGFPIYRRHHIWTPRKRGKQIGRLLYTHHSQGELWYLRLLLTKIRGPTSWDALKRINGVQYKTFKDACRSYGLLDDDNEWHEVLSECCKSGFPSQIRQLFVHIIVNCQVTDLLHLWNLHWKHMVDDIILRQRNVSESPQTILNDKQLEFYALAEIDKLLRSIGKSLKQYSQLPLPPMSYMQAGSNNLVIDETSYNMAEMAAEFDKLFQKCNAEQLDVFNAVLRSVDKNEGQSKEEIESLKKFSEWVLRIGNGQIATPRDGLFDYEEDDIVIPAQFCDPQLTNDVENMIMWTYPKFLDNYKSPQYISERAILTPTNQIVAHLNSAIVETIPGESFSYFSVDRAEDFGA
ncbi:hypothetical protein POM88_053299 [Heracleum sosnowskyi]|uniref:ATP-dependent DNA helicase n=1 Tax=Heracleum sosnowskyi TaxID=360622 RepID=A0AAD8GQH1_9APIA|nr:hypothetical protein POM88_053299 [Heracleum sosnowskyi]